MQLQVEEHLEAALPQPVQNLVSGRIVELHPHLEPAAGPLQPIHQIHGRIGGREVERHNQAVFGLRAGRCTEASANGLVLRLVRRGRGFHGHSLT